MEPRLKTSRKWSPLPEEFITQVGSVFKQNFSKQVGTGTIEVQGKIFPEEILIGAGFRESGALKQSNWVVSIAYKRSKDNVLKLLHLAVDANASLFEQFFASEDDSEFPRIWEEIDFEGRKIYVQYNTVNSRLESEADRLLGVKESSDVAQGDWDADDDEEIKPEHIKAHLGIDPNDDEDGGEVH